MSIVTDKDTIFVDELIRENARLTVQHEADKERILALSDRVEQLEQDEGSVNAAMEACAEAQDRARIAEAKLGGVNAMLAKAIEDLHFVMAGGDACKVCTRKCTFGTGDCKPVWKGEEAEE